MKKIVLTYTLCLSFIIASVLVLSQCTKREVSIPEVAQTASDLFTVTAKEALEVAQRHKASQKNSSADSPARIGSIFEVTDQKTILDSVDNTPLLHIINQKNGFTIVSADLRTMPILAYSDKKHLDIGDMPNGVKLWIESAKMKIRDVKKRDLKNNDIVNKEWKKYLSDKNGRIADTNCYEWYQYGQFMCQGTFTDVGPLLTTEWSQKGVSSSMLTNNYKDCDGCGRYLAGCAAVAMAQIDEFYHPVSSRPRGTSNSNCGSNTTGENSLGNLMASCGFQANSSYDYLGTCNTFTWPDNVKSGFSNLGYSNGGTTKASNDFQSIKFDLKSNHPIIFYGSTCLTCFSDYHIWVCDGIEDHNYSEFNCATKQCYNWSFTYLSMNWGWQYGNWNGWFALGQYNPDGANYDANMHVITGIRP